jgi:hypothetical protein
MDEQSQALEEAVEPGGRVYDGDGRLLGHVSTLTEDGFEIASIDGDDIDRGELPGQEFGEGYLMWRCGECGDMGDIGGGIPERCPACNAPREAIMKVLED